MKLYILHSVSHEDPSSYDSRFETKVFLGAHTSLEKAKTFAARVTELDREEYNKELETGEAEMPELTLTWSVAYKDLGDRDVFSSDTVELFEAFHFEINESVLDPRL